jgi:hypothetical protein
VAAAVAAHRVVQAVVVVQEARAVRAAKAFFNRIQRPVAISFQILLLCLLALVPAIAEQSMKVKRQLALIKQTRTRALNCRAFVVTAFVI